MHHGDACCQRHRLDLVVRDVHDRGAQPLMQPLDLHAHLDAQLRIQIGQRLVEQEQQRITHQGAAHRHALTLPAGKLRRLAVEQRLDLQQPRHARQDLGLLAASARRRHSMPKVMFCRTVIDGYSA